MNDTTATIQVPDGITPVVGWRAWRWYADMNGGARLRSVYQRALWEPHVALHASCGETPEGARRWARDHGLVVPPDFIPHAPANACTCGIYALELPDHQLEGFPLAPNEIVIIGRVALWGTVVKHNNGWRGEFAYPQALYVPDESYETEKERLGIYGVPVLRRSLAPKIPASAGVELLINLQVPKATAAVSAALQASVLAAVRGSMAQITKTRTPWHITALRLVMLAVVLGSAMLQGFGVISNLWWGATGASDLRPWLGGGLAFFQILMAVWYVQMALRIWRSVRG